MPTLITPLAGNVSTLKARDVDKLLAKHFGDGWKEMELLKYYRNIIDGPLQETPEICDTGYQNDCEVTDLVV